MEWSGAGDRWLSLCLSLTSYLGGSDGSLPRLRPMIRSRSISRWRHEAKSAHGCGIRHIYVSANSAVRYAVSCVLVCERVVKYKKSLISLH